MHIVPQDLAVQTRAPAVEAFVPRADLPLVTVGAGKSRSRASVTQTNSASVTVMASMVRDRFVPFYWQTNPSDCNQPASAASAISDRWIWPRHGCHAVATAACPSA